PRAVHAEAVALAGADARQVAVPAVRRALAKLEAALAAVVVEQAQLDLVGDRREQREVGAGAVVVGAERARLSGPHGGFGFAHLVAFSSGHAPARAQRGWGTKQLPCPASS